MVGKLRDLSGSGVWEMFNLGYILLIQRSISFPLFFII